MINRGGEKIYPREIEDFLAAQPGVWSVAVVAAQDEVLGERPVAYVVPAGPWRRHEMEEALREACEAALPGPSGQVRSAWSRSYRWVPPARSRGTACGTAATRIWSTAQGRDDRRQAPPFVPLKDQTAGEAVVQPCARQSAQSTTCPVYADISGKCHGLSPLMVEDLRFVESFVDHSTHNHPIS